MRDTKTTPAPAQRADPSAAPQKARGTELVQLTAALLSASVLVLYGIQYSALERFYDAFGITPEQAGIGRTEMLTRLIVWLAFLANMALVVVPTFNATGLFLFKKFEGRWSERLEQSLRSPSVPFMSDEAAAQSRPSAVRWIRWVILTGLGGALSGATLIRFPGPRIAAFVPTMTEWILGMLLAAAVLTLAIYFPRRWRAAGEILIVLCLVLLGSSYALSNNMGQRGTEVMRTGQWGLREQFLGLRLQYVTAQFAQSPGLPKRTDFTGIYLGEANGTYVLYDCASAVVLQVSTAQVHLIRSLEGVTDIYVTRGSCLARNLPGRD